ncbi:YqhV family protein [Aquibacillus salsiterrae]|uniref:YqhV family protein n=1 Tax=Aquibacillus salsiterrae TaxID=2950439 RepID=A0A9X4AFI1_9BACI|nr:YqhV family protein [Aquibacillus salsiterrae]MDC3416230.1 YqhV family protein [Aquibacillus salsiterrae]
MDKAILGMALLRLLSGTIEISAAFLIFKIHQVDKALLINSSLAIVGPLILIITTSIGLLSIAADISYVKIIWIFVGIICIFYGVSK